MTRIQYNCTKCNHEMIREKYNKTYSEGKIASLRESKEGKCCGIIMSKKEI